MSAVLLCATDAGGAANLAPLIPAIRRAGGAPRVVTRRDLRRLFDTLDDSALVDAPETAPDASAAAILAREAPRAVIAGTTRYDSIDRRLVSHAAAAGIRSTVVLDERYAYASRFAVDGGFCWPDAVTVLDDASIDEAAADGVPRRLCHATGSPALAEIADRVRQLESAPAERPASLAALPDRPTVVFISETIVDDYGRDETGGPLGPFAGFTEDTVLEQLIESLEGIGPIVLVNKRHPSAGNGIAPRGTADIAVVTVTDEALWPLLRAAHAVVGMRSIGLLEAALLGVPAVSFQPGGLGEERCTAVRLGLVPRLESQASLAAWCGVRMRAPRIHLVPPDLPAARTGAAERVVEVALAGVRTAG